MIVFLCQNMYNYHFLIMNTAFIFNKETYEYACYALRYILMGVNTSFADNQELQTLCSIMWSNMPLGFSCISISFIVLTCRLVFILFWKDNCISTLIMFATKRRYNAYFKNLSVHNVLPTNLFSHFYWILTIDLAILLTIYVDEMHM